MPKAPKQISQLDDAPDKQIYDYNPIQNYGINLLKTMGFSEQRGIGFNKQNALNQPLILKPRPKGLGLGAQLQNQQNDNHQFNKKDYILIKNQPHKDMIGIIKKVKNEQKILTIQLGVSGTEIKLKFEDVEKITEQDYNQRKTRILDEKKLLQGEQKKRKKIRWILPSILCKVVSKTSQYYLKKVIVSQLISEREFQCIHVNENGEKKYLRDFIEKDLQTVIPKVGGVVLVMDKKFRGKKAKLLQRNKQKGEVIVQILETLQIEKISQDLVSEYIQI